MKWNKLLAVSTPGKVLSVVLTVLVILGLLNTCMSLVRLLDSDTLYPAGLYDNLFLKGYSISNEAYNDHPGFFPDCLVYWPLLALVPLGPATALYAFAWFGSLLVLTYLMLRRMGVDFELSLLGTLAAGVVEAIILHQPPVSAPGDRQLLQVMYPHSHGTAILLGLLFILIIRRCGRTRNHLIAASLLFVPTVAAVVSDKIVIVHTLAPLCLTLLVLSLKLPELEARIWIPFSALCSFLGLKIIHYMPFLGLGYFDGVYTVSRITPSVDLTVVMDVAGLSVACPSIGITLGSWILLSSVALYKLLRSDVKTESEKQSSLLFQVFLISVALGAVGAVAVSKFWSGLWTIRYIFPLFVLAPTGAVLGLVSLTSRRSVFYGLAALVVAGSVPTFVAEAPNFDLNDLATPYPQDIQCLDRFAKEHGVTRGYSEYWSARRANLFSRQGISITPVHSRLVPYPMSSNLESFHGPGEVEFVLTKKLDQQMLRGFFGAPQLEEKCGGDSIFLLDPKQGVPTEKGSLLHLSLIHI